MRYATMMLYLSTAIPATAQVTVPAPSIGAMAIDPARLAAARQLIDTILPPATRDETFAQMVTAQMGNMVRGIVQGQGLDDVFAKHPDAGKVFTRFVDRQRQLALDDLKQATPALMEAEAAAYARRFTVDEMISIRIFFASPIGQKYRTESITVLADPGVARWQSDVTARAQARLKPDLSKLMAELKPIIDRDEEAAHVKHS